MTEAAIPLGLRLSYFPVGDPTQKETSTALILEMPPGYVLRRHAHDCHRVEVVVKGSIDVGDRVLYPGDVMVVGPGEMYGPHTAGPEGCTSVEIFGSQAGVGRVTYDTPNGPEVVEYQRIAR